MEVTDIFIVLCLSCIQVCTL